MRLKLRFILWPYLRVLTLFIAAAVLLHAALFAALPAYEPADWLWTWVGPIALSAAVVIVGLWPNFRLIKEMRAGRGSAGQLPAMVAIVVLVCAWDGIGHFMRASLSPLQPLATLAELPLHPPTRYYQVRNLMLDTPHLGLERTVEVAGKHQESLDFQVFAACPVARADPAPSAAIPAWLGFTYRLNVKKNDLPAANEAAFRSFLRTSQQQFNLDKVRPFTYLERCPNDGKLAGLRAAASHSDLSHAGQPLILLPVYTPFAQRGDGAWHFLWWSLAIGNGLLLLLLLVLPLDATHRENLLAGDPIYYSTGWLTDYIKPFYPRPGYLATPLLLNANLLIYGIMAFSTSSGIGNFNSQTLLAWGADYGPAVAAGEWWRLLTSTFLHGGFLHLANNMALLGLLGWQLERALGGLRVLAVYLLAGIGSSLISVWWHPAIVGVGASGALFGWMGLGLTLYWRPQTDVGLKALLGTFILLSGGLSLVMGFLTPNVDNAAHLGGLFIGALLGVGLWPWLRQGLEANALSIEDSTA